MGRHVPVFDIFPHDHRMNLVAQDGRYYFRSYTPNFVSGVESNHFFFDTFDDLCTFLATAFINDTCKKVVIKYDRGYAPERFVMGCDANNCHWILGFVQNINKDEKDITITMEET